MSNLSVRRGRLCLRDGVVMTGANARGALNQIWRPAIRYCVAFHCYCYDLASKMHFMRPWHGFREFREALYS
jgi:hypothetical protein